MVMKLLVYDFPFRGPWGRAFTDAMQPLARDRAAAGQWSIRR
jgi:hypothetical protein